MFRHGMFYKSHILLLCQKTNLGRRNNSENLNEPNQTTSLQNLLSEKVENDLQRQLFVLLFDFDVFYTYKSQVF